VTTKRVVQYHIARLKDKRPDIRLQAIRELELLADPDALAPLKVVYTNDEDPEVRRVAQEAGRTIFLKNQQSE
jgi:HEAT repeat protein